MYLLGIDIGTTNWKVGVYDLKGRLVHLTKSPALTYQDKYGYFYKPEEIFEKICGLIRQAVQKIGEPKKILAVGVASMGEAGLPIGKNGKPLYPVILWYDERTKPQVSFWDKKIGRDELFSITGINLGYIYGVQKILWIKENFPSTFLKTKKWLSLSDYIIFQLSGEYVTDYSLASRLMLLDLKKRNWSERLLRLADIDRDILPHLVDSGVVVGEISKTASGFTELVSGTPIVTGGHDHIVGALAVGICEEGEILDSTGTAESIFAPLDSPKLSSGIFRSSFSVGCHTAKNKYYLLGGIYAAGGLIEWFIEQFIRPKGKKRGSRESRDKEIYKDLVELAQRAKAGSAGLFLLPHIRGSGPPHRDLNSRGAFIGITAKHSLSDFVNALFEGLSYESRLMIEGIEKVINKKPKRYVVIGGATQNEHWLKVKTNIIGRTIYLPQKVEAVSLGAALLAGIGIGIYRDEKDALKSINLKFEQIKPDKKLSSLYDKYYKEVYQKIYKELKELNQIISHLP